MTERTDDPAFFDKFFDLSLPQKVSKPAMRRKIIVDPVYGPSAINDGDITVYVGTHIYSGWLSAHVSRSLDAAASSFQVTADGWSADAIPVNSAVQIHVDGEPVLSGWLEQIQDQTTPKMRSVTLAGRSRTCDLVDCTARSGIPGGMDLQQIGNVLAKPYGVTVKTEVSDLPLETSFRTQHGETVFEALERQARSRFLLLTDTPAGDLLLTRAGASGDDATQNVLVMGGNIMSSTVSYDWSQRFKHYTLRSQGTQGGDVYHRERGDAEDVNVTRYRNLTVSGGSQMPGTKAVDRAIRERQARIGKSITAQYEVQGWRAPDKKLWRPNMLVSVWDETQGWMGEILLVSEVSFSFSNEGRLTTSLTCKPRAAYEAPETTKARTGRGTGGLRNLSGGNLAVAIGTLLAQRVALSDAAKSTKVHWLPDRKDLK